MKKYLPFLLGAALLSSRTSAQINAGDVPVNAGVSSPGIILILSAPFSSDSETFDLNCDGTPDMRAVLLKGEPAIDAPNVAWLELLDPALELCKDQANYERPQYHSFGQPLDCTGVFTWQNDSVNTIGDFGGFTAIGPVVIDTMYVAYRKGSDVGWVKLSFILNNTLSVSLQIHQVLEYCGATGMDDLSVAPFSVHPNPTDGAMIRVESAQPVQRLEVLTAAGKVIARHGAGTRTFAAPEEPGTYLVRATFADGGRSVSRLVRY